MQLVQLALTAAFIMVRLQEPSKVKDLSSHPAAVAAAAAPFLESLRAIHEVVSEGGRPDLTETDFSGVLRDGHHRVAWDTSEETGVVVGGGGFGSGDDSSEDEAVPIYGVIGVAPANARRPRVET